MKVVGPQGTEWTVRRRWLPRYEGRGLRARLAKRRRRRGGKERSEGDGGRWWDWLEVPLDDSLAGIAVAIAVVAAIVLIVLFGLPLLLALVDVVVVLGAAAAGVIGRVLFRRPWTVEACSSTGERHEFPVVGWRRAGERIDEIAKAIQYGNPIGPGPPNRT